jgi:hypothetical protein
MPLRKADVTGTKRFEDGEDWLELRLELSKGESDRLRDLTASYRLPADQVGTADAGSVEIRQRIAEGNRALFEFLAVAWSLPDELSGAGYAALDEESGRWVDECIETVLRERRERAVKNGRSSKKRTGRGSSSARAAASATTDS